jgi:hypothetical protein
MLLVRHVFHAKYGRGDEVMALFKEMNQYMPADPSARLMVDASGRFFTFVTENEVESLAAWEKGFAEMMSDTVNQPAVQDLMTRMNDLIDSGSREFYTIVE